ncbi:BRcat and Rcat domain-containing protein [Aspergillus homomorphus CBS 101889]|uniref:IBR domain-containing protein n=1 Tax=Aspergillus homomorphus (strain CBS 101889) TaxID=1450537 RepID=A0A395I1T4_ASPHC|nr:hypothetical protein BO97DRAFT_34780 [Aspergillus homomorphus CBS 101889]RAL13649.1 hypothetical protein BO97DRAFT_34780 [Aspergillus homomorphus CBS 101889]
MPAMFAKSLSSRAVPQSSEAHPKPEGSRTMRGSRSYSQSSDAASGVDAASPDPLSSEKNGRTRSRVKRFLAKLRGKFTKEQAKSETTDERCVCCLDIMPAECLVSMPCQHKYCSRCMKQMVFTVMSEEGLFPPRCCKLNIPTEVILPVLTLKEKTFYMSKAQEYATPAAERRYCPTAICGRFIPPQHLNSKSPSQACPYCGTKICSGCRDLAHTSKGCFPDPGLAAFLEEARLKQWQRCYSCGSMVELMSGCDHVTCRCKAQFCYKCGDPWFACACAASGQRPADFLAVLIGHTKLSRDQEAELSAVVTAILRNERLRDEEAAKSKLMTKGSSRESKRLSRQSMDLLRRDSIL